MMAVPGETVCREVAPCGSGTWGDIVVEPDSQHVQRSYSGMDSDGSALKPWTTIQAAVNAAAPGAIVAIAAGSYPEHVIVRDKAVRLWGVCPALVEVVASGLPQGPISVLEGASGTVVRDLAMRGDAPGAIVSGSLDVRLERVWVHDNGNRGIVVQDDFGPTSITLSDSLLEQNRDIGLFVATAEATVVTSVIRDGQADAQGFGGRGVSVQAHSPTGAALILERSVIERNRELGLFVSASEATVTASVIRETAPDVRGFGGRGASVQLGMGSPSTLLLEESLVDRNHGVGVLAVGSSTTMIRSVIRDTAHDVEEFSGEGVHLQMDAATSVPSTLVLQQALVSRNRGSAVVVSGSDATVEASMLRGMGREGEGHGGHGLSLQYDPMTGARSTGFLRTSLIAEGRFSGLFVAGADATMEASIVTATAPDEMGAYGRGINAQAFSDQPATLVVERSIIETNREVGAYIHDSVANIHQSLVRGTMADGQGLFGNGIAVLSQFGSGEATITATRIEHNQLAAIAAWGARAALGGSALVCHSFDLNAESLSGKPPVLEDLGDNGCGCPEPTAACKSTTGQLAPPSPLEPPSE
jgi:hypothetical protein